MKSHILELLQTGLKPLISDNKSIQINITACKNKQHGDYASNIAMQISGKLKQSPLVIAQQIIANLPQSQHIEKTQIAGPGFINFYLKAASQVDIIRTILTEKHFFGCRVSSKPKKIILEYVSANPTGPLHVGHGRGAAYGDSLANLLRSQGQHVQTEYYINDAGRQMDILAVSVWLRYLSLIDKTATHFPKSGYRGDYIWDLAADLHRNNKDDFFITSEDLLDNVCLDTAEDQEQHIDQLILKAKSFLKNNYSLIFKLALDVITQNIKDDLSQFRVEYDSWFSERSLSEKIEPTISLLEKNHFVYLQDNSKWFKSTSFGDEKDRVLQRSNGLNTYFASDICYHQNKIERNYDMLINIWGADHHGYITRVKAGMSALGFDADRLKILLVQFANLFHSGVPVQMSTRSGSFVTLAELYREVGVDAARFFYVERKPEQHLDFDLDLAKAQNSDNPVYYIQYAHARVFQVLKKLADNNLEFNQQQGLQNLDLLTLDYEISIIRKLNQYPEMLKNAAMQFAPHKIPLYLSKLAQDFHGFYNSQKFIVQDDKLRDARICLITAVAQTIANGLKIIGVAAPKKM